MGKKKPIKTIELGRRERQIMDGLHRLGEGSVRQVLDQLPDPPSYSAVRTMIRLLESKGFLKHRQVGKKYVYRPTQSRESASRSALKHLMKTFFRNSATDAVAAILDVSSQQLGEEELQTIESLIERARAEEK